MAYFSALVITFAPLVLLLVVVRRIVQVWQALSHEQDDYRQRDRRTITDITDQAPYIPDNLRGVITQLEALGFRMLGAAEMFYPTLNSVRRQWALVDQPETTRAMLIAFEWSPYVSLESSFEDGGWVETVRPMRGLYAKPLQLPDQWFDTARTADLAAIYRTHQERVAAFQPGHGALTPIHTMADYLDGVALYAARHRASHMLVRIRLYRLTLWLFVGLALLLLLWFAFTASYLFGLIRPSLQMATGITVSFVMVSVLMSIVRRILARRPAHSV